jgi:hypothetical protein
MKKIPKKLIDEQIEATRLYWNGSSRIALDQMRDSAFKIEKSYGIDFIAVWDFISAILKPHGIYPDAENDEIYCALRCLGWDTVE